MKWLDRTPKELPHYGLCLDEKAFIEELQRLKIDHPWPKFIKNPQSHATAHILTHKGKLAIIVCMEREVAAKRKAIEVAGLLIHESVHIVQEHFVSIGEHEPGDEAQAYAIQWVSQCLMQSYVEQTRRRKR